MDQCYFAAFGPEHCLYALYGLPMTTPLPNSDDLLSVCNRGPAGRGARCMQLTSRPTVTRAGQIGRYSTSPSKSISICSYSHLVAARAQGTSLARCEFGWLEQPIGSMVSMASIAIACRVLRDSV